MPEIKNTFLKGKMNKSLDDRLLPEGEYRDALNVQITKNDAAGSDVGVVHNIKGNELAHDTLNLTSSYKVIGAFFDDKNNRIFYFITDGANDHRIYKWEPDTNPVVICEGSFLKFSKTNLITGINVLEDFLFWTDGKNQPRRLNIETALENLPSIYYNSEIKISVAKYAPFKAPQIIYAENDPNIRSERIKEEFVRFSYRYKFKDNEYSILAPFSPITFKMESNIIEDLLETAGATEVANVVNNVNKITMNIPLPNSGSTGAKEDYEIEKIEILYKESDSPAIRIVDTINVADSNNTGYEQYVYKSTNFKSTLPEDQLTRVFDNVPLKAVAQEISGNRVIYGNVTFKQDLPVIDYTVTYSEKSEGKRADTVENIYKAQSIKQRRSYDVGLVLVDIFGRTSPVILSETSTIYVDPKDKTFDNTGWDGDSIKISINSITSNNTLYDEVNNPTGWYSYRVVIKQNEQDYYNVYTPGIWNYGSPKSYFTIHGDNINKVPRDTTNSDNNDQFAPSSVRLYPKVLNIRGDYDEEYTYRNAISGLLDVKDIGNLNDHSLLHVTKLYEDEKNHLIGKIDGYLGTQYILSRNEGDFAVFETEPFESAIDIYYETPTCGLLSSIDTNDYILDDFSVDHDTNTKTTDNFSENNIEGNTATSLHPLDGDGNEIPGSLITFTIVSQDVSDRYDVRYNSNTAHWELYLKNGFAATSATNNYTVTLSASGLGVTLPNTDIIIPEINASPTMAANHTNFTFDLSTRIPNSTLTANNVILKLYGSNGSGDVNSNKTGLTFTPTYLENTTDDPGVDALATYSQYIGIAQNKDIDSEGNVIDKDGTAILYYASDFSGNQNVGDTFTIKFKVSEFDSPNTVDSDEFTVVIAVSDGNVANSDDVMSGQLYYASGTTFDNAYDACQDPVSSINWSPKTVYWNGDTANGGVTDPFVVETESVSPDRMYNDFNLSIPATAGWYKRTDTGVIGYYQILGSEPDTFKGWYYATPDYCAGLTEAEAIANTQYNPPSDTSDDADDPDNPYDLPPKDDNNIP